MSSPLSILNPTVDGAKDRYVRGEIDEDELEKQIERALTHDADPHQLAESAIAVSLCAVVANAILEAADE